MCKGPKDERKQHVRVPEEYFEPDPRDAKNKDHWVKRHPDLVRLTGIHPFNVEPPLNQLLQHGHHTPASLHYVRNHGAVPIAWSSEVEKAKIRADWRITVASTSSRIEAKRTSQWSFAEMESKFKQHDVECLLVCAGNRRKEQNMVKRTIGFNWGAAGLGMSTWSGIYIADLLAACGAPTDPAKQDGLFVRFRGPLKELPAGDDGSYGTSLTLRYAMDRSNDVILACQQNGIDLQPDHGFPVRIIIPGFIGGRMVKWLEYIEIADSESQNHYHFKDNRVLPVNVTPESADAEGWWYKPDYIINELNINAAIAKPAHDEVISPPATDNEMYTLEGYAYSGGGRKIIRVEITLDDGNSWRLCSDVTHPPKSPTPAGKYWGWCIWRLDVPVADLLSARSVRCRAWDNAMNTMPPNLTWNVMGMLNNPWFTIMLHKDKDNTRRAEHPTKPGQEKGGWMTDDAMSNVKHWNVNEALKLVNAGDERMVSSSSEGAVIEDMHKSEQFAALPEAAKTNIISPEELAKHKDESSCWIAINGIVYDTTPYLETHPGGGESITMLGGQDSTEDFAAIHSAKAWKLLNDFGIGVLGTSSTTTVSKSSSGSDSKVTLVSSSKISLKLVQKDKLSHNSYRLRFALPSTDHILGLPVGKHILVYGKDAQGKLVARAYTPTTADEVKGHVDFVIKSYRPLPPKFPAGGALSQYLCDRIDIGTSVQMRGPLGKIEYVGKGVWKHGDAVFNGIDRIGLIAGGTGVTPCLQVITAALLDEDDKTVLSLILANQTEDDILCRDILEGFAKSHPDRFHLWYTLDRAPTDWKYSTGFVNAELIDQHLPKASPSTLVMCCGPPPMINYACKPNFAKLGFSEDHQFYF